MANRFDKMDRKLDHILKRLDGDTTKVEIIDIHIKDVTADIAIIKERRSAHLEQSDAGKID